MIFLKPVDRAAQQETAHFVTAVVENVTVPVRVVTLAGVGMLEQVRSVEVRQTMLVARKVRRNPVQNDANIMLMQVVNQILEVLRRSIAAGWRKVPGCLITPRPVERMLGYRHKLDMGEPHAIEVFCELRSHLAV